MTATTQRRPRGHGVTVAGEPRAERSRKWLEYYRAHAKAKGGACLSTEYTTAHEHLHWRCAQGHEWHAEANSIRHGRWCPACADLHRHDAKKARMFARVRAIARRHGGACLSTEYVDDKTHLLWRCAEGHEWEAVPGSVAAGTWCGACAGVAPLSLDDMHEVARARGGKCLSRSYLNVLTPLRWRCAEGHEWMARPSNVRTNGSWCPHCAGHARKTIADMHAMAAERGGECLSTTIDTVVEPLRWRCRVGHVFETNANEVQQGGWCPRCRKTPKGSLERLRRAVARRGGELLTTEYVDSKTPVRVRCSGGARVGADARAVARGELVPRVLLRVDGRAGGAEARDRRHARRRGTSRWALPLGHLRQQRDEAALAMPCRARVGRTAVQDPLRGLVSDVRLSAPGHDRRHASARSRTRR